MPQTGLEPVHLAVTDFKSVVSTVPPPGLMVHCTTKYYVESGSSLSVIETTSTPGSSDSCHIIK